MSRKPIRWLAPSLIVIVVWAAIAVVPTGGSRAEARDRADAATTEFEAVQRRNDDLLGFAVIGDDALDRVEVIETAIPPTAGVADLIEMLAVLGTTWELQISEISPSAAPSSIIADTDEAAEPDGTLTAEELAAMEDELIAAETAVDEPDSELSRVAVGLRGTGPYGSVLAFVDELSEGERLIQVSSLDLRPDDTETDMIQFSLELIAFTTATVAADEDAGPGGPGGAELDLAFEEES